MRSFLKEIEDKFIELEEDQLSNLDIDDSTEEDDLEEMSTSAAVPGYNTPNAFMTSKQFDKKKKKIKYESINTKPSYSGDSDQYQRPESEEEEYNAKFPFALDSEEWQHDKYEYPSVNLVGTPGTASKKHKTLTVEDMIEKKYEQLIEGYRDFKSGDQKPSSKIKSTIQEIAKKLHEIETLVNYNTKLKTESGVTSSAYGPATTKALTKISERLIKISERIRTLGE